VCRGPVWLVMAPCRFLGRQVGSTWQEGPTRFVTGADGACARKRRTGARVRPKTTGERRRSRAQLGGGAGGGGPGNRGSGSGKSGRLPRLRRSRPAGRSRCLTRRIGP